MAQQKKIAVLGGGVASMTSVFELTSIPDWQEKYDITLYQYGWRLGGKCASGRNPDIAQRIEEHGLHLWFGFYDNSFDFIQRVYAANNRPQGAPLATWQEALKPCNFAVLEENPDNKGVVWEDWPFQFPANDLVPGIQGNKQDSISNMAAKMMQEIGAMYAENKDLLTQNNHTTHPTHQNLLQHIVEHVKGGVSLIEEGIESVGLLLIEHILSWLDKELHKLDKGKNWILIQLIEKFLDSLQHRVLNAVEANAELTKFWIIVEFSLTTFKGMIEDEVFSKGFDSINDIDFKAWLRKHGASDLTAESCMVQALYSLIFAGRDQYTTEAGTSIRGLLLLGLYYKGSFYYRMQAGMGDTIFSPLYEVLIKRGVKFKFFHKVNELLLSADRKSVDKIIIGKQVNIIEGDYHPLVNVKALPCWPSYPLYDQLLEGKILKEKNIDLEDPWADWKDVESIELVQGRDFDTVLYGMSIGTIPFICKDILSDNQVWNDMVNHISTVSTQAMQLWLKPDVSGLGWNYWTRDAAIYGTYVEPYDTYADMSDLIIREAWDAGVSNPDSGENLWPNHLAYFCGPLMDVVFPPYSDHGFPARMMEKARACQLDFLNNYSKHFWPGAVDQGGFKWDLLVDSEKRIGIERLLSQYSRVNLSPSEQYVLSVVNSSKYRLEPWESGYQNLVLTGDWTRTGINAGCVEATVISGKKAANFISGTRSFIPWEKDIL